MKNYISRKSNEDNRSRDQVTFIFRCLLLNQTAQASAVDAVSSTRYFLGGIYLFVFLSMRYESAIFKSRQYSATLIRDVFAGIS